MCLFEEVCLEMNLGFKVIVVFPSHTSDWCVHVDMVQSVLSYSGVEEEGKKRGQIKM